MTAGSTWGLQSRANDDLTLWMFTPQLSHWFDAMTLLAKRVTFTHLNSYRVKTWFYSTPKF